MKKLYAYDENRRFITVSIDHPHHILFSIMDETTAIEARADTPSLPDLRG